MLLKLASEGSLPNSCQGCCLRCFDFSPAASRKGSSEILETVEVPVVLHPLLLRTWLSGDGDMVRQALNLGHVV